MRYWTIGLCLALSSFAAADLQNGNFDSDLASWDLNGSVNWSSEGNPADGYAHLNGSGELGQKRWLCGDTPEPDMLCLVTFKYRSDAAAAVPVLSVTFGNAGAAGAVTNLNGTLGVWTAGTITSKECTLKDILFSQLSASPVDIDSIKGVCVNAAPEPASFAGLGLGALVLFKRRTRKS